MIEAVPITEVQNDPAYESDTKSFSYSDGRLLVDLETAENEVYRVAFGEQIWAFRYMEEGDLTYYWQSGKFDGNFLIYEITAGGWLSKEQSPLDILGIARSGDWLREWFVPTKNFSITVLSNSQPTIERTQNA